MSICLGVYSKIPSYFFKNYLFWFLLNSFRRFQFLQDFRWDIFQQYLWEFHQVFCWKSYMSSFGNFFRSSAIPWGVSSRIFFRSSGSFFQGRLFKNYWWFSSEISQEFVFYFGIYRKFFLRNTIRITNWRILNKFLLEYFEEYLPFLWEFLQIFTKLVKEFLQEYYSRSSIRNYSRSITLVVSPTIPPWLSSEISQWVLLWSFSRVF